MKLVLGIKDEYEGDAPLYFDLSSDPAILVDYIVNNIEKDKPYEFTVSNMPLKTFNELGK